MNPDTGPALPCPLLQPMRATGDERQHFLATYMRTTLAVKHELERGGFVDENALSHSAFPSAARFEAGAETCGFGSNESGTVARQPDQ